VKGGFTVNLCALDIAKALIRVDHFALLKFLMDRFLLQYFIKLLHDSLLKCYACVRWGCAFSFWFGIQAGVKQGGCLSLVLFTIYMDVLIIRLKESGYGCQSQGAYFGCLLYANDIMLLSHLLGAMRYMLKIRDDFANKCYEKFKITSRGCHSHCSNKMCKLFVLPGNTLQFVCSLKYIILDLLVLLSHRRIKVYVKHVKVKFFRAFNCI